MEGRYKRNDVCFRYHGVSVFHISGRLPLTCIEAMALGKPVIATNIPGPSEIVLDGVTGYLVPQSNPEILAERILNLVNDRELLTSMGKQGKMRAKEFLI